MENLEITSLLTVYKNKKVLITGHTGFKGSWLSKWLLLLGAKVYGYSLAPDDRSTLYHQLELDANMKSHIQDIRNVAILKKCISDIKPDIIFHLAAQSLVKQSYKDPLETVQTNILGTANVLDAVRQLNLPTTIIVITSDKCYENKEWLYGYRENDPMGGYDPYSMSKGAAELVVSSWRRSFFNTNDYAKHGVKLASARAGNVIGGGDWAENRIVPDCIQSLQKNIPIKVRNPLATRPWQHVLEPLGAYLILGSKLLTCTDEKLEDYCSGFNFGPRSTSNKTVENLVEEILKKWGNGTWTFNKDEAHHEAFLLNLSIDKAFHLLDWKPIWDFETTVDKTIGWYKQHTKTPNNMLKYTEQQIREYSRLL